MSFHETTLDQAAPLLPRGRMSMRTVAGHAGGKVYLYVPHTWQPGGPLLVAVHGISRNAREQVQLFAPWAERCGFAILAPLYARDRYPDYQRLGLENGGRRADEFLNAALDSFAGWAGAPVSDVSLFGFSGGAQFAHRYAILHPRRVCAVVLGAAGWYTMPDESRPFPLGVNGLGVASGDLDRWLALPMLVLVGSADTRRNSALRQSHELDVQQGRNRVERAQRFVARMQAAAARRGRASRASLALLPGIGHDFSDSMTRGGLAEQALPFLGLSAPTVSGVRQ